MWISPLKSQIINSEKKIDSIMRGRMPENCSSEDPSQDPSTSAGAVADEKLDGNRNFSLK